MHVLLWRFSLLVTTVSGIITVLVFLDPKETTTEIKQLWMGLVVTVNLLAYCAARAYDEATHYHQRRAVQAAAMPGPRSAADSSRGQGA